MRVILILTDGLRPDAVTPGRMPFLHQLADEHVVALSATTVRPSTTVAALATLATGLEPETHGLLEPGLGFLRRLAQLEPLPRALARAGIRTRIVASDLPPIQRRVAPLLAAAAGVATFRCVGTQAREVAAGALDVAAGGGRQMLFVYLNDCDRAGHTHGWMSPEYLEAAVELDAAVGLLAPLAASSLLVILADHGGGGVVPTHHREPHPLNDAIPLVLAGPDVERRRRLTDPVSIVDVPPTMCHWLGVPVPDTFEGRVLTEAFARPAAPVALPA